MSKSWYSTVEIAEALGVTPQTVRNLIRKYKLPYVKLASQWRISSDSYFKLMEKSRRGS